MFDREACKRALDAARYFKSIGLVPLPSKMDRKQPTLHEYRKYRTESVPPGVYFDDQWQTTNLQLMTGVETPGATKIVVVDLDGPEAAAAWRAICLRQQYSLSGGKNHPWVATTGSGGTHLYFRVPVVSPVPSRMIWGLYDTLTGWVKHREIRILGDGGLAVAPPSLRVDGAGCYAWHGRFSPRTIPMPDVAPGWLLAMPGVVAPDRKPYDQPEPKHVNCSHDGLRNKVIAAIPSQDKIGHARNWGLRFADAYPSLRQKWIPCHAIDREDKMPTPASITLLESTVIWGAVTLSVHFLIWPLSWGPSVPGRTPLIHWRTSTT